MKSPKREAFRRDSVRALSGVVLVPVMVLATAVAISAEPPPTLIRPEIAKIAMPEPDSLALGDTVRFFIIVENPKNAPPDYDVVDWYQVQATDVVSSVLEIDTAKSNIVGYVGEEPVMEITDNTVVVTVDWMRPGDYFIFQIFFICRAPCNICCSCRTGNLAHIQGALQPV